MDHDDLQPVDYRAFRAARRLALAEREPDLTFEVEAEGAKRLLARYVPKDGLLPDVWGKRVHLYPEESVQFYEAAVVNKSADPCGRPHLYLPPHLLERRRLKNGALRLSPGRARNGYPKLYACKIASDEVERLLAWVQEARQEARRNRRLLFKEIQAEERERILALWRQRQAVNFTPHLRTARRPSGMALGLERAAA